MATKTKPNIYRVSKSHAVASTMKPGQRMTARMRMLDPDEASEGDEGTLPMEEEMAELHAEPAPKKAKARTPAELVKQRRMAKVPADNG